MTVLRLFDFDHTSTKFDGIIYSADDVTAVAKQQSIPLMEISEIRIEGKNLLIRKADGSEVAFQTESQTETEEWYAFVPI